MLSKDAGFVRSDVLGEEGPRRDVVELVGVDACDPIARIDAVANALEHIRAQADIARDVPAGMGGDAGLALREVADDRPGLIGAPRVEDVHAIKAPGKVREGLGDDVALVAHQEEGVQPHARM